MGGAYKFCRETTESAPWVSLNEQYARCEASPLGERYPLGLVQDSNVTQNNTVRSYKL
ncbi:hypothetical protein H1P_3870005 [Hyella patelloides LEGE 07179]|uniref:Uncharacterized protein n=1 Tax=Hyella patelloides LEGE 07179 TaxID=945734 RepID=A0A563VWU1_9CYAN|nr:hypothetical protein H1P_3870005 [Hyella patelloides LEGE 07179]